MGHTAARRSTIRARRTRVFRADRDRCMDSSREVCMASQCLKGVLGRGDHKRDKRGILGRTLSSMVVRQT